MFGLSQGRNSSQHMKRHLQCGEQQASPSNCALQKDWVAQTGTPKPRLEYQGSDSFLKKQFKYCAKGEMVFLHPSISSQHCRRSGGRKPPPSETTLLWAERNAWRQVCQLMADGVTLKNSLKQMKENQLFWTREVYERIMFQQLRFPKEPKGKGKGKGKGKTKSAKGVYQDHLKSSPSGQKGGGKFEKGQAKGGRPSGWPTNWALQSPSGVLYCRDFHLKHSCQGNCNRSHACPIRVNGWTCNGDHSPDKCTNKGKP